MALYAATRLKIHFSYPQVQWREAQKSFQAARRVVLMHLGTPHSTTLGILSRAFLSPFNLRASFTFRNKKLSEKNFSELLFIGNYFFGINKFRKNFFRNDTLSGRSIFGNMKYRIDRLSQGKVPIRNNDLSEKNLPEFCFIGKNFFWIQKILDR